MKYLALSTVVSGSPYTPMVKQDTFVFQRMPISSTKIQIHYDNWYYALGYISF